GVVVGRVRGWDLCDSGEAVELLFGEHRLASRSTVRDLVAARMDVERWEGVLDGTQDLVPGTEQLDHRDVLRHGDAVLDPSGRRRALDRRACYARRGSVL